MYFDLYHDFLVCDCICVLYIEDICTFPGPRYLLPHKGPSPQGRRLCCILGQAKLTKYASIAKIQATFVWILKSGKCRIFFTHIQPLSIIKYRIRKVK